MCIYLRRPLFLYNRAFFFCYPSEAFSVRRSPYGVREFSEKPCKVTSVIICVDIEHVTALNMNGFSVAVRTCVTKLKYFKDCRLRFHIENTDFLKCGQ